jgi:hypothetical protein
VDILRLIDDQMIGGTGAAPADANFVLHFA